MLPIALCALLLAGPTVKSDIVYRSVDDTGLMLDLYMPEKPVRRPVPIAIMIHGGAWISGKRSDMAPLAEALADKGVAVANLDYRLAPKAKWPAMIDDCQEAVRFLRKNAAEYGIDPKRMGAIGGSAGGHLSLLLGFTDNMGPDTAAPSARVKAVVNLFGPADLSQDFDKNLANLISTQVLGKKYDPSSNDVKEFSPINRIDANSAPVYTIQGKADPLVPFKQADRLDEAMKKAGREHVEVLVDGMGHGVTAKDPEVENKIRSELEKGLDWLVAKLRQ